MESLTWTAENESFDEAVSKDEVIQKRMNPIYAVTVDSSGRILDIRSSSGTYDQDKVENVVKGIQKTGAGKNRWHSWLYVTEKKDGNDYIVFSDYRMDAGDYRIFFGGLLLVAAGLMAMLAVSVHLSNFVVQPAQEALEREKRFISNASHELKTPVAAIQINAQVLAQEEQNNRFVANILTETDRLSELIRELLTFSWLEEKGSRIEKEIFSLSECCEQMALSYESIAFEKKVHFDYQIEPDISFFGNRQELGRVVSILLDNASRHTPENGEIQLKLAKRGRHILLIVSNTGKAIPAEDLPHIFDRFYRVQRERSTEGKNFGLGLSIAKATVEAHHGSIFVESSDREGTQFEVVL